MAVAGRAAASDHLGVIGSSGASSARSASSRLTALGHSSRSALSLQPAASSLLQSLDN